jgi:hypothetical protein
MAKVKAVINCKSCNAELYSKDQKRCHNCGALLNSLSSMYELPDYLVLQQHDLLDQINGGEQEKAKKTKEIESSLIEYLKNSPPEDKISAMYDAFYQLKYTLFVDMNHDEMRKIVSLGKRIGSLSESIENYIKNQGGVNATRVLEEAFAEYDGEGLENS